MENFLKWEKVSVQLVSEWWVKNEWVDMVHAVRVVGENNYSQ